jgi:L-lactate dehydrogenase
MKVGIIGSGMVGATSAYAIMMRKAASDIVLIDVKEKQPLRRSAEIIKSKIDEYEKNCIKSELNS